MTLKEMIEEARMMAETPDLDVVRSSQDDLSEYSSRKSSTSQGIALYFGTSYKCMYVFMYNKIHVIHII